jgi:uracil phosphoribosyltransferase
MIIRVLGEEIPYARWLLRVLRDEATGLGKFREAMRRAGFLLAVEASEELSWRPSRIRTPLGVYATELEIELNPLVVAILGASLPMAEGVLYAYPDAPLALVAAKRVEENGDVRVEVLYKRLPSEWRGPAFIVDPMLATGMTISETAKIVKGLGADKLVVLSIIAAPEGLKRLSEEVGDIIVYTLSIDKGLNDRYFIVPGLGDAGDRGLGVAPT